jgi:BASS family bile acid:Na+ symporter
VIGLLNQLVLVPLIALGVVYFMDLPPEIAIGILTVAACPGGVVSNLVNHICKGDLALSITLTAFSSVICLFTTPLIVKFAVQHFASNNAALQFDSMTMVLKLFFVVLLPIAVGMLTKIKFPVFAQGIQQPIKYIASLILISAIGVICAKQGSHLLQLIALCGGAVAIFHFLNLILGYGIAVLSRLSIQQQVTICIETGYQNNTFALVIATAILHNDMIAVPAAIYGLVKILSASFLVYVTSKFVIRPTFLTT